MDDHRPHAGTESGLQADSSPISSPIRGLSCGRGADPRDVLDRRRLTCDDCAVETYIRLPCRCGSNEYVERPEGRVRRQPFCAVCGARLQTASGLTFTQRVIIALIVTAVLLVVITLLAIFAPIWWTIGVGIAVVIVVSVFVVAQVM